VRTDRPGRGRGPKPDDVFAEAISRLRACWVVQGPSGCPNHAQDVQVAVADLEREQDVEPPQGDRAVDVEEVGREHAGGLGARRNCRQLVSVLRTAAGWIRCRFRIRRDRRGTDPVAELEQLTLNPDVSQLGFSRAIRATNTATTSSIGGRPGRF
jgi:hypothetical protein